MHVRSNKFYGLLMYGFTVANLCWCKLIYFKNMLAMFYLCQQMLSAGTNYKGCFKTPAEKSFLSLQSAIFCEWNFIFLIQTLHCTINCRNWCPIPSKKYLWNVHKIDIMGTCCCFDLQKACELWNSNIVHCGYFFTICTNNTFVQVKTSLLHKCKEISSMGSPGNFFTSVVW